MMHEWLIDAIEKNNVPFLIELVKVLDKCPINIERLKQNDTPKLLKQLVKSENKELSTSAKQLRSKWRKFILDADKQNTEDNMKQIKEKRKLNDKSNSQDNINKKLKIKDENLNTDITNKSTPPPSNQQSPVIDKNALNTLNTNDLIKSEDKPKVNMTAKVKLGKSRSIGVLEKNNENGCTKPLSTTKSASKHASVNGSFITKSAMLLNQTSSTPSLPLNKLKKVDDKGIKIIDAQPLSFNELANQASSQTAKHIIKESAGFMDELNAVSSTPKLKKKKKKDDKVSEKGTNKTRRDSESDEQNDSVRMEIDDLDLNLNVTPTDCNKQFNEINSIESPKRNETEYLEFRTPVPFDSEKRAKKSILQVTPKPKTPEELEIRKNRRIRWASEEELEKVKLFELDDQERCNVWKNKDNSFNEHRKKDTTDERVLLNAKQFKCTPSTFVKNWKLTKIDLPVSETVIGSKSLEKEIQQQRLSSVLEDINIFGPKPEFPKEPDNTESINNDIITNMIPLDEENHMVADFSNEVYTIHPSNIINNNIDNNLYGHNQSIGSNNINSLPMSNNNQLYSQDYSNLNLLNSINQLSQTQQPQQNVYNNAPYAQMFNTQSVLPQNQQQTSQMNMQQQSDNSRWNQSNWTNTPIQNNFQNNNNRNDHQNNNNVNVNSMNNNNSNNNSNNNRNNRNHRFGNGSKPCKFFSKNGKCFRGDKCAFKH